MSNWQKSTSSPGFLYFQNATSSPAPSQPLPDFVPFSESPNSGSGNTPTSSPQHQQRGRFNQRGGGGRGGGGGFRNGWKNQNHRRYSSQHSHANSPNSSFNSSYDNDSSFNNSSMCDSFGGNTSSNNSFNKNETRHFNLNAFLHPSFTEDPWAHLVKKS